MIARRARMACGKREANEVAISHLMCMRPGYICVAGIDEETGQHVRPVIYGRLSAALLARYGGPFELGAVVALGAVHVEARPPEVEDRRFEPKRARQLRMLDGATFWRLLHDTAQTSLAAIFGPDLRPASRTAALSAGHGIASLGCLIPAAPPQLALDSAGKLRCTFSDGALTVNVSVTDLRLYEDDYTTPRTETVERIAARLAAGVPTILSVGLSRAFQKSEGSEALHWLQLNNVHLADDPLWR
jgi:hypothetical protein